MHLQTIDWLVIAITLAICFGPALFFGRRAGRNTSEFFASGRAVPWWLAGLSMVATTFSSDTPNLVTDIVRRNGRRRQLGVVGVRAHRRGDGVLLRAAVAAVGRADRSRVLRDPLFRRARRAVVRGFRAVYLGPVLQLHDHGDGEPGRVQDRRRAVRPRALADAAGRRPAQRRLRRALRACGACSSST